MNYKYKYQCKKCKQSFKNRMDLDSHSDVHTPYWNGKRITLSGADQIRLMLKSWSGSWRNIINDERKRVKQKGDEDLKKMIRLRDFEKENNIEFVVCGDKVEQYRCLTSEANSQ